MSSNSRSAAPEPTRRQALAALATTLVLPAFDAGASVALPAPLATELPGARLQGQGTLRFLGMHIYDARLWAPGSVRPDAVERTALALELQYARTLRGPLIAERSIEEMRRVGDFSAEQGQRWEATMARMFPDVRAGDRIFGLQRPGDGARFLLGERFLGEVRDAEFARLFFGIWLSPRTSEPALRAALLGLS